MSVWLTIPSARPPAEAEPILAKWRQQGYRIALWIDQDVYEQRRRKYAHHQLVIGDGCRYPGYAVAVNTLVRNVLSIDPECNWVVAAGDDTEPDLNHTADEIAAECEGFFLALNIARGWPTQSDPAPHAVPSVMHTFGVMQPTGDRFDGGQIDRICGSPWMGREFCRRINQGRGPLWPEYKHMFVDEELQHVAIKYGVLWQRPDLIHLHRHFARRDDSLTSPAVGCREGGVDLYGGAKKPRPAFLDEANSGEHWSKYKGIFLARKAAGFPGSEPL